MALANKGTFMRLPDELKINILSFTAPATLANMRSVNKKCSALIDDTIGKISRQAAENHITTPPLYRDPAWKAKYVEIASQQWSVLRSRVETFQQSPWLLLVQANHMPGELEGLIDFWWTWVREGGTGELCILTGWA